MWLQNIEAINFRSYRRITLGDFQQINIIYGPNGTGKTNLLEAIALAALGYSFRTNQLKNLILIGQSFLHLNYKIKNRQGNHHLELKYSADGQKYHAVESVAVKKTSVWLSYFHAVIFTSEDLKIVKGGPGYRRGFLDRELAQISLIYRENLAKYEHAVKQRNTLLLTIKRGLAKRETLEIWDEQIVNLGTEIMLKRFYFIQKLKPLARLMYRHLTGGLENLEVTYYCQVLGSEQAGGMAIDGKNLKEIFYSSLRERRQKEIERGTSLVGPHHDDLIFGFNNMDLRTFGSQGQQRTAALALRLAELELIKAEIGEYPVLLLDDFTSELDYQRRQQLLRAVTQKTQTFLTTTDPDYAGDFSKKSFFYATQIPGDLT